MKRNMSSVFTLNDLKGLKVTIMGLGLNGGGIETCRFLSRHGARITVTDLRTEEILAPALKEIAGCYDRLVLGRHDDEDFIHADLVMKNPAVRPNNKYIAMSKAVETDLSLFLNLIENPVIGVSGSKGKSTTASAIHYGLLGAWPQAKLGGNITISPLSFFEDLDPKTPLVLELSSFQLGDLATSRSYRLQGRLKAFPPHIAVMTSIFHDHQDYYGAMEPYLADKAQLFKGQGSGDFGLFRADDPYGLAFAQTCSSQVLMSETRPGRGLDAGISGAWLDHDMTGWFKTQGQRVQILPENLVLPGKHHRGNLLQAALGLKTFGVDPGIICERLGNFSGIEHRLEPCGALNGISFVNDSAATIPEAALAAVKSLDGPVHLITGGTDKALSFDVFVDIARAAARLTLLKGSASEQIARLLNEHNLPYDGPYDDLDQALAMTFKGARKGATVLLSPGCASFGMFLNEFDRGRKYKAAVARLIADSTHTDR